MEPTEPQTTGGSSTLVQSVERAIALLHSVADASPTGETVANLALTNGLNRATAWRLLATLEANGLVERNPASNRYVIGFAMARLATAAGLDGLVRRTHSILERLCKQTGETADLAVARPLGLTYIDEVAPSAVLSANWLGRQVPLHATSTGKARRAWRPEAELSALIDARLMAFTDTTISDPQRLRAELHATRARGYGVCIGELERNLYGVSAPVLDSHSRPFAIVSIWGPRDRVPESRLPALGLLAVEAAAEIARVVTG
jgi:DNA-binding IclR family transcriptional regulator